MYHRGHSSNTYDDTIWSILSGEDVSAVEGDVREVV
jgi:hypothetical protein